jgi:hypothetical protein
MHKARLQRAPASTPSSVISDPCATWRLVGSWCLSNPHHLAPCCIRPYRADGRHNAAHRDHLGRCAHHNRPCGGSTCSAGSSGGRHAMTAGRRAPSACTVSASSTSRTCAAPAGPTPHSGPAQPPRQQLQDDAARASGVKAAQPISRYRSASNPAASVHSLIDASILAGQDSYQGNMMNIPECESTTIPRHQWAAAFHPRPTQLALLPTLRSLPALHPSISRISSLGEAT